MSSLDRARAKLAEIETKIAGLQEGLPITNASDVDVRPALREHYEDLAQKYRELIATLKKAES